MARHLWICTCALSICCLALAFHHAHANEQLRHAPADAGDQADTFDTSISEVSRIDRGIQLTLERRKRNALNDGNHLDDRFTRMRRSEKDPDENLFIKNDDQDSKFQESNRDERGFFEEDGLAEQDENEDRSKRSVEDETRRAFSYQVLEDGDGNDAQDDTSYRVFERFRRSLEDEIFFGDDTRSDINKDEKEEREASFREKRHVADKSEETEFETEDSSSRKARTAGRIRRTLPGDRTAEVDSAEDDKDDGTISGERLKRSTSDASEDDHEDVFRLKQDVDNEDRFMNYFNPTANIRIKRDSYTVPDSDSNKNTVTLSSAHNRRKRSQQQNFLSFESELGQESLRSLKETVEIRTRTRRSAKDKKQAAGGAHQVSSYTAYELKPAATSHKGKSGSEGGSSGHKKGFSAASGHKSGSGHKAGKGFSVDSKGSHDKKGASGHKEAGGKKYAGGEHKSHSYKGGDSGKKGSKSHKKGHSAHKSKGQKQGGFKNKQDKDESGGSKSFYDKSDHKGYHSKYDHYDSFHVSSEGGEKEKGSHASKKTHDIHGKSGHKEAGKHHNDEAAHKGEHGSKGSHDHTKTTEKKASHDSKHEVKH